MRCKQNRRRGAVVVESALVYPVVMLLILGLVIGALGIMRYQTVASLARRAARYAAVHSNLYAKHTGNPAATPAEIYDKAILPFAVGMDPDLLGCTVKYANGKNWVYQSTIINNAVEVTTNTVSVTVTYRWVPEAFLGGIDLTSTSVMPMSN